MTRAEDQVVEPTTSGVATNKDAAIKQYQQHTKDTGSSHVQVAILTTRINSLTEHLKIHRKDNHSRRGLILMVGKRRKLLDYIKSKKPAEYQKLIQDLKLRK